MQFGIRERLTLIAALAFLAPAVLSVVIAYDRWQRVEHEAGAELNAVTSELTAHYKSIVQETHGALAVLANHPALENFDDVRVCASLLADSRNRVQLSVGQLQNITFVSTQGTAICSAVARGPLNLRDTPWFRRVVDESRASVEDFRLGQRTTAAIMTVATPVFSSDGNVTGVLIGSLDLHYITLRLTAILDQMLSTVVFSSDGTLLFRYPSADTLVGHSFPDADIVHAARSIVIPHAIRVAGFDGEPRLTAIRPLTADRTVFAAVRVTNDDAYAAVWAFAWLQAVLLLLSAGLAAAIWFVGHRSVVTPLRALATAARGLQAGDFTARVRIPGHTELQAVARTFNNMAATIESRTTEQERDRATLGETTARLRGIIDSAPFAIFVLDAGRNVQLWSRGAEAIFGYKAHEVIGQAFPLVPTDRLAEHADLFNTVMTGGRLLGTEVQRQRKDGTLVDVRITGNPLRGPDGNIQGGLYTFVDIAEEKRAAAALRAAESDLTTLVDAAPVPIIGTDLHGCVTLWNPASERLFGWSRSEVLGKALPIVDDDRRAEARGLVERVRGGERISGIAARPVRKDGTVIEVEVSMAPVFDADGRCRGIVSSHLDVTERNRIAAQLRQSQKMEAVGQLTGGIAHDFNNLLGIVIGNLDVLQDELGPDHPSSELVRAAVDACLRGSQLNRSLLAFSRQQELAPQRIDVGPALQNLTTLMRRTLGERVELSLNVAPDARAIRADPAQLESAILNLSVNARDAMPKGGRLMIEVANQEFDESDIAENPDMVAGRYVMIAISDTGSGMSADVLARVFEPFFTTKEVGKGSGLGLSMVFGFMKQSGGQVKIYSDEGRGTTVRLYFPADGSQAARPDPAAAPDKPARSAPGNFGTVLLVEDNEALRRVAVREFSQLGFTVLEAGTGEEALERLKNGTRIDLLFTDVVMPGRIDGVALGHEAARLRPGLRILLTSGFTERATEGVTHEKLPWPLLSKPYRKAELAATIHAVMSGRPLANGR